MAEAGTYDGPFEVPAGVTLVGAGVGRTRIVAPAGDFAIRLTPGDTPTSLRTLTVLGLQGYAVLAIGAGAASLEDVDLVVPERGAGLGVQDLTSLQVRRVRVTGPVSSEDAEALPSQPSTAEHATLGIVVFGAADALLEDVTVSGFAAAGVVLGRSTTVATGLVVQQTAAVGIGVIGGEASFEGARVSEVFAGTSLYPAYGVLAQGAAVLSTSATSIADTDGLGLAQMGGSGTHDALGVSGNAEGGIWLQDLEGLDATGTTVQRNGMAGVIVQTSADVHFDGLEVSDTSMIVRNESAREIMVGDGVQVISSLPGLMIRDATISRCGRVGLLLATESSDLSTTTLEAITIESAGEALGAVMQGADAPGWDDGIARGSTAAVNDGAFVGELDIVGAVTPTDLPLGGLDTTDVLGAVTPTD